MIFTAACHLLAAILFVVFVAIIFGFRYNIIYYVDKHVKEILIDDIGDDVPESEDNIDENYKA